MYLLPQPAQTIAPTQKKPNDLRNTDVLQSQLFYAQPALERYKSVTAWRETEESLNWVASTEICLLLDERSRFAAEC